MRPWGIIWWPAIPGSWEPGGIIMPWGIMGDPMGLGEGSWPDMAWDRGWPMLFMPMGLRAGFGPVMRGCPGW